MLEIRNLHAYYGDSHVLQGIELNIGDAGRVAVLGRNGAGKSTLLKSIMNAGPRIEGSIKFLKKPLDGMQPHLRTQQGICLVPEDRRIFPHLTVLENIAMARYAVTPPNDAISPAQIIERFPMLQRVQTQYGSHLSGGQQQMLAVARAVAARPKLLLLDEPTEGLAPVIVEQLAQDVVETYKQNQSGLLLCEQNLWFARQCTSYVYVLDVGNIVFSGTWQDFDADETIKHRYLSV